MYPCPVLEDSGDYEAVETHADPTEPAPAVPRALDCGRSHRPHPRQAGGGLAVQLIDDEKWWLEEARPCVHVTQLVLSTQCPCPPQFRAAALTPT